MDVPDDETAMALLLATGSLGNVRSQTLKGFSAEEMEPIFAKIP
ncbi:MAG: GYD domain-containing protein [Acidiferrobacterales bacterium]